MLSAVECAMSMMLLTIQGTELLDSMVAEESVEQRGELLVLLSQGGSHGVREVRDHILMVEPKNSWLRSAPWVWSWLSRGAWAILSCSC